jgi:F-type H+-transporting ATPase subunit b
MKIPEKTCGKQFIKWFFVIGICLCLAGGVMASSGGDGAGHEAEGHAEAKGWVATDTYRVMNFAVLFILLFVLLRKPIPAALNSRIAGIKNQLEELEARKAAAEKQLAQYNAKMAGLDQEAAKMMAEYVRQAEEAKTRILASAQAAAEKLQEQTQRNIENEYEKAKIAIQAEVMEKALAKAEAFLQAKITADDQTRLVDEYLEKVVA